VLLFAVADIVAYLINILVTIIIVQFVLSLLISFNVVNLHNQFVAAVWQAVNALLDPILRPVRKLMARILPDTGALDFSPLVLIVALTVLQKIVTYMAYASTI
jgi:YggT family protein